MSRPSRPGRLAPFLWVALALVAPGCKSSDTPSDPPAEQVAEPETGVPEGPPLGAPRPKLPPDEVIPPDDAR